MAKKTGKPNQQTVGQWHDDTAEYRPTHAYSDGSRCRAIGLGLEENRYPASEDGPNLLLHIDWLLGYFGSEIKNPGDGESAGEAGESIPAF